MYDKTAWRAFQVVSAPLALAMGGVVVYTVAPYLQNTLGLPEPMSYAMAVGVPVGSAACAHILQDKTSSITGKALSGLGFLGFLAFSSVTVIQSVDFKQTAEDNTVLKEQISDLQKAYTSAESLVAEHKVPSAEALIAEAKATHAKAVETCITEFSKRRTACKTAADSALELSLASAPKQATQGAEELKRLQARKDVALSALNKARDQLKSDAERKGLPLYVLALSTVPELFASFFIMLFFIASRKLSEVSVVDNFKSTYKALSGKDQLLLDMKDAVLPPELFKDGKLIVNRVAKHYGVHHATAAKLAAEYQAPRPKLRSVAK